MLQLLGTSKLRFHSEILLLLSLGHGRDIQTLGCLKFKVYLSCHFFYSKIPHVLISTIHFIVCTLWIFKLVLRSDH